MFAQQPQPPVAPSQTAATESSPAGKAAIPTLPTEFKGETTGIDPGSLQSYRNTSELQITNQEGGRITGTYTRWTRVPSAPANLCIEADKLPMTGTYDGEKIVPAVEGILNNPVCADYSVSFIRGKDHYFERKSPGRQDGLVPRSGQIGVPHAVPGLLARIDASREWELRPRRGLDYELLAPDAAIRPFEDEISINAAIAMRATFAQGAPAVVAFFDGLVELPTRVARKQ